jgi:hypothetical protein
MIIFGQPIKNTKIRIILILIILLTSLAIGMIIL